MQAMMIPIRDRGTAINAWAMLRKRFLLPKIIQDLGLHSLEMATSASAEITLSDFMQVCEKLSARFGWDPREKVVEKGSESVTTRADDEYTYTHTLGRLHPGRTEKPIALSKTEVLICVRPGL